MPVESLLLCRDAEVLRVLRRAFEEVDVRVLVATSAVEANDLIARRKFDAIVVDCDDLPGTHTLLRQLRIGSSNRAAIVFAIVSGVTSVSSAYDLGANFVCQKPLQQERLVRSIRAAHGLMLRERHRYLRHEVSIPVTLHVNGAQQMGTITNLSEGGMALRTTPALPASGSLRLIFTLPGTNRAIDGRGEIAWNSGERAGIRLPFLPEKLKTDLINWLNRPPETAKPALFFDTARQTGRIRGVPTRSA